MTTARTRLLGSTVAAVLALASTAAAQDGAGAVNTGLYHSQGTTLAQVRQQAATEAQRAQVAAADVRAGQRRGGMLTSAMTDMDMATTATTVQGPTNLATAVGGSWNNYAFTIPNDPSCPGGVGTQQATDDHTTAKACPDGANGASGAVHAVQLYDGKVLIMAGSGNQWMNLQAGDFTTWVWDPTQTDQSKAWKFVPTPYDMFCAGHVELPNGNILVTGGTTSYPQYDAQGNLVHDWNGSKQSYIFDVTSESYVQTGSMANARWYPTVISVGGGKILVTGGLDDQASKLGVASHNTDTSELYTPSTGKWTALPTLDFTLTDPSKVSAKAGTNATRTLPYYPGLTLLKGGKLFYSGESNGDNGVSPGIWDYKSGAFTPVAALPFDYQRNAGATVLLPPAQNQKVMVMGGGDFSLPTTADTEIMNLSSTSSPSALSWTKGPAMSAAKMYVGAVILPDRTVFETNGASQFRQGGVHTAEDYNPATNKFTVMNSPTLDRLYHSNAFLEPTGQVAVLGSQPLDASFEMHISIYNPPYLFKSTRPTITGTRIAFTYTNTAQGKFSVKLAAGATLAHAMLMRPSATTHSTDPDQREIDLGITKNADGSYGFTPPTDDTIAPEGQYMLYVEDSKGIPSQAMWVSLGAPLASGGTSTPPSTGLTLAETSMSGWVAKLAASSAIAGAGQDVTLQVLTNGTWAYATNALTDASGKLTFTWGGGGTLQLRAVILATGTISNTVTVTYGP